MSFKRVALPDNIWDQIDELRRRLDDLCANAVIPQNNPADPNPDVVYIPISVVDTPTVDLTMEGMALSADVVPGGIKLDDLGTPDDNTDLNATMTEHGLLPRLDNDPTHFLNGQGAWAAPAGGGGPPPGYYGDGHDGDVTISADTALPVCIPHYNNLTIDAGKKLSLQSTTIFVKDTLTLNGSIENIGGDGQNGNPNAGAAGGAGGSYGTPGDISCVISPPHNQSGTNGGNSGSNGVNGNDCDWEFNIFPLVVLSTNPSQAGAKGGDGAVGNGGTGGVGDGGNTGISPRNYAFATMLGIDVAQTFFANPLSGGAAGGGGGSSAGGGGGGGAGGDGGNIVIIARHIVWGAAGAIKSLGGAGGDGGASSGDGGGGGGGAGGNGGIAILCYEDEVGVRNVDLSGGTGGNGGTSVSATAGDDGPDGYDGVVIDLGA